MKFGTLTRVHIRPVPNKTRFRFHLLFRELEQSVEFEIPYSDAMAIMDALQGLQRKHGIPIPESLRPTRGKPTLSLVKTDDDD
jgi:hypothetical protein